MAHLETEVLVIGGGATGAGVARDLAMRGFTTVLVERSDLTTGTTGRYHGLLHSGARYAVRDPLAARECIEENRILRRILPQCIEDTGGFFVLTPWDDPDYVPPFLAGCQAAGIPVEELSIGQMLHEEPLLNPQITRCFRVPDGSADSFCATQANAASAREHGAVILTYHKVIRLLTAGDRPPTTESAVGGRPSAVVTGALVHDLVKDEEIRIEAGMVVNAAGAWAGAIAGMVGVQVRIVPGKGTMLAANHRIVHTVVNRCRMCADADILVPAHTVAVIGTTDIPVKDPDHIAIEPWEVQLMLEEGDKLVPGFKDMRMLRAWAGVRPLVRESQSQDQAASAGNREMPRSFVLMDHAERDGVNGLITITSGKWTTYRKMAEATADLVCHKLGVQRPCRTHLEPLPDPTPGRHPAPHGYHRLGVPLARVENAVGAGLAPALEADPSTTQGAGARPARTTRYTDLVCECELATVDDVRKSILEGQAQTIDDIRRDVRLGMGPCQGGFCTLRAAGLLHSLRQVDIESTNVALRDFLQERWKGLHPVLWGQQLRQERLDELIYLSVLNAGSLPGPRASRLAAIPYETTTDRRPPTADIAGAMGPVRSSHPTGGRPPVVSSQPTGNRELDVLIIGAGLAGLSAAARAGERELKVRVIAKGWGSLYWNAGGIDVLGYSPLEPERLVESPAEALAQLIRHRPDHPYALAGIDTLEAALRWLQSLCAGEGYPLHGSLERNWKLPTALGTVRPACLAPETMIAGDMRENDPVLVVGFAGYLDFFPELIAANLERQGIPARGLLLDLPSVRDERLITARALAQKFERPEFRQELAAALLPRLAAPAGQPSPDRVGLPAVLGLDRPLEILHDLETRLGLPVFEIPGLPPSLPGIRLHNLLVKAVEKHGGRVFDGMQVSGATAEQGRLKGVWSEAAARPRLQPARSFLLATGGILGGGLKGLPEGAVHETIFDLPLQAPPARGEWLEREFLAPAGHPVFRAGLRVNPGFQPIDPSGQIVFPNLWAAGAALAGCDPIWERSVEGIALATGWRSGNLISTDRLSTWRNA
jgi:glycerol-3-phosphate dehydrogenase